MLSLWVEVIDYIVLEARDYIAVWVEARDYIVLEARDYIAVWVELIDYIAVTHPMIIEAIISLLFARLTLWIKIYDM